MAFMIAFGKCVACRHSIHFNPDYVPSIRVRWEGNLPVPDGNGVREPLCRACAETLHARIAQSGGHPPAIHPNAYESEEVP